MLTQSHPEVELSADDCRAELKIVRRRLSEAEEALEVICGGEVDAVVVGGPSGQKIYTITNADRPYRLLIEQMKEGALTLLPNGLVVYCNQAFAELIGKDTGQISGTHIQRLLRQTDIAPFETLLSSPVGGRKALTLIASQGIEIPVNISLSPLPDSSEGRLVCGIITDLRQIRQSKKELADAGDRLADQIAVRQRAEALLHQAQKMEVVGQLTGGLAHDFNNLLMIISGNLDLIRRRITDEKLTLRLDQVLTAVQRGGKLTQQLLAFSRIQTLSPESVSINSLVSQIEMLLRRALSSEIEIAFDMQDDLWLCRIDPNQLESAILNLAINARHAMPKEGILTIASRNIVLSPDAAVDLGEIQPGRYVLLTVKDTGTGMPPDVLARVFEPFFTTKEIGKGSGLGLSQVYGFARQSGGHITISSTVGEGTTVALYLPWTEKVEADVVTEAKPTELNSGLGIKILIVEDDADLRELATHLVEELGYSACSASTGPEAIAKLEQDKKIGLLFSDILMPGGLNGFELAARVRERWPHIPILLTSGFQGNFLAGEHPKDPFGMIRKPFTQLELSAGLSKARRTMQGCVAERRLDA